MEAHIAQCTAAWRRALELASRPGLARLLGGPRGRSPNSPQRSSSEPPRSQAASRHGEPRPGHAAEDGTSSRAPDEEPDIATLSAVVAKCGMAGNWALARRLLEGLRRVVPPHPLVEVGSAAEELAQCERLGQWERALELLARCGIEGSGGVDAGGELSAMCAAAGAVVTCAKSDQWARALAVLDGMREGGSASGAGTPRTPR